MLKRLLCCLLLCAVHQTAAAQEALVLSGGGARGLAHAGVLQGLEELGYDPEIVVGTSMGAVVGALYAAGYTPEEIYARILAIDWNEVFTPTPAVVGPDRAVRYPMLSFDLNVGPLRGPRGLVPQWRINRALAEVLFGANARARGDFDQLARRFRAVAADLQTGEAVVLAAGDLARAARASMAVPGVFAPISWGDRVLVDGGIINNLPTDVARDMGARQVIAVDVSRASDEIPSQTPWAVLGRALDLMQENTQRDPIPPDALILPQLDPNFSGVIFPEDPRPLFATGLAAAERDLGPSPARVREEPRPLLGPPDTLHDLIIEAPDSALAALARHIFAGAAPGPYDPDAVLTALDRLYTTGLLEGVWPRVIEHPDTGRAAPVLLVRLDAPPKVSLSAAAGYEVDRGARIWGSLDRYTRIGRLPGLLTASASADGLEWWGSLAARIYTLNRPALAWSTGIYLKERDVPMFGEEALRGSGVLRAGGWAALEFPHILRERLTTTVFRTEWVREEEGEAGVSLGPLLRFTSLNPEFLTVGVPFLLEGEVRWGAIAYSRLAFRGSHAFGLGRVLLAGVADVRATGGAGAPGDVLPALGDEHAVPGLRWGEERGRTRLVVGADAAYPIRGAFARLRVRTGMVADQITELSDATPITGAHLGMLWRYPLAALEAGVGVNTRGDRRLEISLGRNF